MSNFNTNLRVGFPPLWAPTDQKAPLWMGETKIFFFAKAKASLVCDQSLNS